VILDGAHNPQKIKFLINFLRKSQIPNLKSQIILVLAFKRGKDWKRMVDLLLNNLPIREVIATKFYAVTDTGRFSAVEPSEIRDFVPSAKCFENSQEAVWEAIVKCQMSNVGCQIIVTGSLYLVGEVRTMWRLPSFA
jgi:folylpolyglutamate synthase/dihydropteroate synthase